MQAETLPRAALLSSALAGNEITPAEYNAALPVAELEDSAADFSRATWGQVKAGDTVLMAPYEDDIQEIHIEAIVRYSLEGRTCLKALFTHGRTARLCRRSFWPETRVYILKKGAE